MYHVKEQLVYLGIDIAKAYLDAAIGTERCRFTNDAAGLRELIKWVKQLKGSVQVICESSGGYERALVQALARAGVQISLVQANRVRQFARAAGILAKTGSHRRGGTVRIWQGDAATESHCGNARTRASARIGKSTPALNALAGDGAESRRASERCLGAEIESQFNQPN